MEGMSKPNLAVLLSLLAAVAGCGHSTAASKPAAPDGVRSVQQPPAATPDQTQDSDPLPDPSPVRQVSATGSDATGAEVTGAEATGAEATEGPPRPQRPPADRLPARAGEAEKITFDDLNLGMREDMVYRPFLLTDRVKELEGKRLSIIGYMHPGVETTRNIKEFILLKNTECKFGPGGQADHLAEIHLADGHSTALTTKPVKVEATLKIEPYQGLDGNTWSIYRLEEAKIVP